MPEGSLLGSILYLLYTADFPTASLAITSTSCWWCRHIRFPLIALRYLQTQPWLRTTNWKLKSMRQNRTMLHLSCADKPVAQLSYMIQIPLQEFPKYLWIHFDIIISWWWKIKFRYIKKSLNRSRLLVSPTFAIPLCAWRIKPSIDTLLKHIELLEHVLISYKPCHKHYYNRTMQNLISIITTKTLLQMVELFSVNYNRQTIPT